MDAPEISNLFKQLDQRQKKQEGTPDDSLRMQSIQEESDNSSVSEKSEQEQYSSPQT